MTCDKGSIERFTLMGRSRGKSGVSHFSIIDTKSTTQELTFVRLNALCATVAAARKFMSVVMALAFWLAATQHCNLEAAGVLASHASESSDTGCCASLGGGCDSDGCELVENGAFRNTQDDVVVLIPCLSCYERLICLSLAVPTPGTVELMASPDCLERPLNWVPTWQFVQRAALSPRAPSSIA